MRVLLCVKRDLLGLLAVNRLLQALRGDELAVLFSVKRRVTEPGVAALAALEFLEADLLNRLIFPMAHHVAPVLGTPSRYRTAQEIENDETLAVLECDSLKEPRVRTWIEKIAPKLVVAARFSFIFDDALISAIPCGILNVHPGPLPNYAGLFPVFHQMLAREKQLGCTVHFVNRGIDAGNIIATEWIDFDPARSMLWHSAELYRRGVSQVFAAVQTVRQGEYVPSEKQDVRRRHYFRLPSELELKTFFERGHQLWSTADYLALLAPFGIDEAAFGAPPLFPPESHPTQWAPVHQMNR